MGQKNHDFPYILMGSELTATDQERGLGVAEDSSLKTLTQHEAAVKKANRMLARTGAGIENKMAAILLSLYKSMASPRLEQCAEFWSPHLKMDIELRKVQKRATQMIRVLKQLPYEHWLEHLGLFSLEKREIRGDMTEVYKLWQEKTGKLFSLS